MKSKFSLFASVAVSAFALTYAPADANDTIASAKSPIYVSVFGGVSFLNDVDSYTGTIHSGTKLNLGYLFGGAVGTHLTDELRVELELSHASWTVNSASSSFHPLKPFKGELSATYLLGNLWYDFDSEGQVIPYIGGGLGLGVPSQDLTAGGGLKSETPLKFAFQVGVGAKFALSDKIALDIGYRFKDVPNFTQKFPNIPDSTGNTFASHNVQVALTFDF
jgi:opacity protein-like surface antigen